MLNSHTLRGMRAGLTVLAVLVALASVAEARTFRMSGLWLQQRSPTVQIPIFGGIGNVPNATAQATGSGPATVTIPANQFVRPANPLAFPLNQTTLVQLTTRFSFSAPSAAGVMSSGPKTSRPANFQWCPGAAANPTCTATSSGGTQGTKNGRITYTAGGNQFGGTMQMLMGGTGSLSTLLAGSQAGQQSMQHNTIGGLGTATMNPQVVGGSYENVNTDLLPGGPVTYGGLCPGGPCGLQANGLVTQAGSVVGAGASSTNSNWGFPWTTGAIFGITTNLTGADQDIFTSTGSDTRTPLGAGNLSLVAGGLSARNPSGELYVSLDRVTMTFRPQNLPAMSPTGIAALAAILIAGAGYAIRRRK